MVTITIDAQIVALTIKKQIGTDAWLAVSGRNERYWTTDDGNVTFAFRFGNAYGLPKWCEITYKTGADLYDIVAYKIHRNGVKKTLRIASEFELDGYEYTSYEGVYGDSLPALVRDINTIGWLS
jgi:hypothetical protein